jgi:hypothetical protein
MIHDGHLILFVRHRLSLLCVAGAVMIGEQDGDGVGRARSCPSAREIARCVRGQQTASRDECGRAEQATRIASPAL